MDEATKLHIAAIRKEVLDLTKRHEILAEDHDELKEAYTSHELSIQRLAMSTEHMSKSVEKLATIIGTHLEEERQSYKKTTEQLQIIGWRLFYGLLVVGLANAGIQIYN